MPSSDSRHAARFPLAAALLLAFAGACTGSVEFGPADEEPNCLAYPACDSGDAEVNECPAETSCYEASICGSTLLCAVGVAQCNAYPACNGGDEEVDVCPDDATCYEAEACGSVILCQELVAQCGAIPTCDPDDLDVTAEGCPQDASCYEATLCGTTILCLDEGLAHACPLAEPGGGAICESDQVGLVCDYFEEDGCFKSYHCTDQNNEAPFWQLLGEACP